VRRRDNYRKERFGNQSEDVFGHKLSARTFYMLIRHGLKTKQQVVDIYTRGGLLKLRNVGKVTYNEIFDWLDKDVEPDKKQFRFIIKQKGTK
jgi:DNA-directed RNA polymerase alpha subunit